MLVVTMIVVKSTATTDLFIDGSRVEGYESIAKLLCDRELHKNLTRFNTAQTQKLIS
jgi:hypothetical protein